MSIYNDDYNSVYANDVYIDATFDVKKTRTDNQLVFGWASIAKNADGTIPLDWQGDVLSAETIEKAAYEFVLKYRATGEEHAGGQKGDMVESVVFTKEKMAALGIPEGTVPEGWWVGFHIPDTEVFEKIKKGQYKMFSIQGKAKRIDV